MNPTFHLKVFEQENTHMYVKMVRVRVNFWSRSRNVANCTVCKLIFMPLDLFVIIDVFNLWLPGSFLKYCSKKVDIQRTLQMSFSWVVGKLTWLHLQGGFYFSRECVHRLEGFRCDIHEFQVPRLELLVFCCVRVYIKICVHWMEKFVCLYLLNIVNFK